MVNIWKILYVLVFIQIVFISSCGDESTQTQTPSRVIIIYSPDNNAVVGSPVNFRWGTTSENADSFKLQITQDSSFSSGIETYGTTFTEYNLTPQGDTNYFYWKVTAFWRNHSDSDISFVRRFKIR